MTTSCKKPFEVWSTCHDSPSPSNPFFTFPVDNELDKFGLDLVTSTVLEGTQFRPEDYPIDQNDIMRTKRNFPSSYGEEQEKEHQKRIRNEFEKCRSNLREGKRENPTSTSSSSAASTSSSSNPANNGTYFEVDNRTIHSPLNQQNQVEMTEHEKRVHRNSGRNRLRINFIRFGNPGEIRQVCGFNKRIIPDGLCGTHEAYGERWQFEVNHRNLGGGVIAIEWKIINVSSGIITTRTETRSEAISRQMRGKTISNRVVREALGKRALELETLAMLIRDHHPLRAANLQSKARPLRPKRCVIGLLFFGLVHDTVQNHMSFIISSKDKKDKKAI